MAGYEYDFYKVDPLLFSPALVTFVNLKSGKTFRYGTLNDEVLAESFGESS
ncbi:MAG: methenyltetrahydromethanopterin cyclohydrolase [Lacipirellulaceae bacterium]